MACAINARHLSLLPRVGAKTSAHQRHLPALFTHVRSLNSSRVRSGEGFSVTFGPQIDALIQPKAKGTKSGGRGTTKTTKRIHKDKDDRTIGNKLRASPSNPEKKVSRGQSRTDQRHEENTLQVSDDADGIISKPASTKSVSRDRDNRSTSESRIGTKNRQTPKLGQVAEDKVSIASTAFPQKKLEPWQTQKAALEKKFGEEGWKPRKKLSPDAIEGIRTLQEQNPERYTTSILSEQFKVSPEAIRRILKSKWRPSEETMEDRRQRWARRHDRIWDQKAALGLRPTRKGDRKPEGPEAFEEEVRAKQMLGQL